MATHVDALPTGAIKRKQQQWRAARGLVAHVALIVICIVMLYPLLWMIASSFRSEDTIFSNFTLWPDATFSLRAYFEGWNGLSTSSVSYTHLTLPTTPYV